jgi:ABC-type uncharacterized transport system involved in gliding motility auxiliary subunit
MKFLSVALPFGAIFTCAIGIALGSAFPSAEWLKWAGFGLSLAMAGAWVWVDFSNLKSLFARKGAKYGTSSGVTLIAAMAVIVGLAFLSNRPRFNKQFDATSKGNNTLSEASLNFVQKLKADKVEIEALAFFQDDAQKDEFKALLDLYQRAGATINSKFVDPDKEPLVAQSEKLTSANTVILRNKGREARVTTFNEEKVTNALSNIMKDGGKKVYFLSGHGEGETTSQEGQGFQVATQLLEGQKFEVKPLPLFEKGSVPQDADLVVLAGLKYDLKEQEVGFLKTYLDNGGALIVAVDAVKEVTNLNTLIESYGAKYSNDLVIMNPNDPRAQLYGQNNGIVSGFNKTHGATRDIARKGSVDLMLPFLRTIEKSANTEGLTFDSLAKTSSEVVVRIKGVNSEADLKNLTQDRLENGSFDAIVGISKKVKTEKGEREARLMVVGSSFLVNNQGLMMSAAHRDLFASSFSWLSQDADFIAVPTKEQAESSFEMTTGAAHLGFYSLSYIYPFLFLAASAFYWMRRRTV